MLDLSEHIPASEEPIETELPRRGPDWLMEPTRHAKEKVAYDGGLVSIPHYESGRLHDYLRESVRDERGRLQPMAARLFSAASHHAVGEHELATALTDLCVVGRDSLADLGASAMDQVAAIDWPSVMRAAQGGTVLPHLTSRRTRNGSPRLPTPGLPDFARVEHRARTVAAHLDAGPMVRRALDAGWIAVSGEDDLPYRPVNVAVTAYRQSDMPLRVWGLDIGVRYAIAGELTASSRNVLLLHGHSSRLEETEVLAARLLDHGYTVIALDLPGCGYATPIDHQHVLFAEDRSRPQILHPFAVEPQVLSRHSSLYVLRFLVCALRDFVERLFDRHGLPPKLDLIAGGSLGGNLGLLLSQLAPHAHDARHGWVHREFSWVGKVASWSPACLWTVPRIAHGMPHGRSQEKEITDRRRDQFSRWMNVDHLPFITLRQAEQWFRRGWQGKGRAIAEGWMSRHETYSPHFRTWHWIIAHEQVKFSHQHALFSPDGKRTEKRALDLSGGELLLMAGTGDNFPSTRIHDLVRRLGPQIPAAGKAMLWRDTGHSIHCERPAELAHVLDRFVTAA